MIRTNHSMKPEDRRSGVSVRTPENTVLPAESRKKSKPVWIIHEQESDQELAELAPQHQTWLKSTGWEAKHGHYAILPGESGEVTGAVFCVGPSGKTDQSTLPLGVLPKNLPAGTYHFETPPIDPDRAALGWILGSYVFNRYKSSPKSKWPVLKLPGDCNSHHVLEIAKSVYLGRDLINTPANDMGPDELEKAARELARKFKAKIKVIQGDRLLEENFPLIHAVGRASTRAPRLIDMTWGRKQAPAISVIGKGIVFDTGGLNLKPGNSMALMKKDMGGAATALALARMVMAVGLDIRLRLLLPVAENSVSGNAFRPGDVITARNGTTVEIGNTDAEGRLVLADAIALADVDAPDTIITLATLTGAARVALGPDLPAFYTDDDEFADEIMSAGYNTSDPVWRMPFWQPYSKMLTGSTGDLNHISGGPFAGSITAALFLQHFVRNAGRFAHFDIFGWTPTSKPGKPKGGEPQAARAIFRSLKSRYKLRG